MHKSASPLFFGPAVCGAGFLAALIFVASAAPAKKAHRPPSDRDAEELDHPGEAAEWAHAQRACPAFSVPDSVYLTGWAEWTAVTQQPQPSRSGASPFALPAPPQWQLIGPAGL